MLKNIQYLRGTAALLVVTYHASRSSITFDMSNMLGDIFQLYGAAGVDVFFVISGFIMVYIQSENPRGPAPFLVSRFFRVVPLYWVHLLIYTLIVLTLPSVVGTAGHVFDPIHLLLSFTFLSQALLGDYPSVQVGWTLEFEMFFYVLFGLCLLLRSSFARLTVLFSVIVLSSFWAAIMLEFAFGILVGLTFLRYSQLDACFFRKQNINILMFGVIGLLLSPLAVNEGVDRVIAWGVPSLLIIMGAVFSPQGHCPLLEKLGDMSYSLYLSHWFVTPGFYLAANSLLITEWTTSNFVSYLLLIGCIVTCMSVGYITYVVLEKPLMKLKPANIGNPKPA